MQSLGCIKTDTQPVQNQIFNTLQISSNSARRRIEFQLPLQQLIRSDGKSEKQLLFKTGSELVNKFETCDAITGISLSPPETKNPTVNFHIDINHYTSGLLHDILGTNEQDYISKKLFNLPSEKFVLEFSSPNIAKPFHVGHLRSTIHGNFVSNLLQAMGHDVKRLNYLGDWGTQFGFLQFGLDQGWFSWDEISKNPIQLLLDIYIKANAMAEKDDNVATTARNLFKQLESGFNEKLSKDWREIRRFTVKELTQMYSRLGVKFDEFNWESQYGIKELSDVLAALEKTGHLVTTAEGKKVVRLNNQRTVTLVKSDGSSLYLTRDLAAAIDRHQRFQFRKMFYFVDNAQTDHFVALKSLLSYLGYDWASSIEHVKFGRIKGMSTRKGTAVFLRDVLDEAHIRMKSKQMSSPNTKVDVEKSPEVTDTLAVSAIIIHDLKQRRQRDYNFNWDDALQVSNFVRN